MHEDAVLVAVDAALRGPSFCLCGESLAIASHDAALWLECPARARPTRLPAPLAGLLRTLLHERRFVIEVPLSVAGVSNAPRTPGIRGPVATLC